MVCPLGTTEGDTMLGHALKAAWSLARHLPLLRLMVVHLVTSCQHGTLSQSVLGQRPVLSESQSSRREVPCIVCDTSDTDRICLWNREEACQTRL